MRKKMKATLSSLFALLLAAAFLVTGNGLQGILTPIRANIEEFSAIAIGILGSTYF